MTSALLMLALAQVPELDPEDLASWLLEPCGKVVIAPDGAPDLAKEVRRALVKSRRCERVSSSEDAWTPGWTLEQEQLVRERLGSDSQLVVVRSQKLSFVDGHGKVFAEAPLGPEQPLRASPSVQLKDVKATRFEVTLTGGAHVNPLLNRHFMLTGGFTYRPWWFLGFGARVAGTYLFMVDGSAREPLIVDRVEPLAHSMLRLDWAALVTVEAIPLSIAVSPVVELGAGLGGTQHVLNPGLGPLPPTFGSSGVRGVGSMAIGVRIQPVRHLVLRLMLRDLVVPGGVSAINGCDGDDLRAMDTALRSGRMPTTATVRPSCSAAAFGRGDDVPLAYSLTKQTDVPPAHLLSVDLTVGVAF